MYTNHKKDLVIFSYFWRLVPLGIQKVQLPFCEIGQIICEIKVQGFCLKFTHWYLYTYINTLKVM